MTAQEKAKQDVERARQEVEKAKRKLEMAVKNANEEKRKVENRRKYMMGGLIAKYLQEDMNLYFLDLSEEEITRVIAFALRHNATQNFINTLVTKRNLPEIETAKSDTPKADEDEDDFT